MPNSKNIEVIVIGGSTGGVTSVKQLLKRLPYSYSIPIVIVLHRRSNVKSSLVAVLQQSTEIRVKEADEKETLKPGFAYIAPANYHLLVENDRTLAMDYSEPVNYSRPSIDLTMFSIASVFGSRSMGILLSGGGKDGAAGMLKLSNMGATCIAQEPKEAIIRSMPKAAISIASARPMTIDQIGLLMAQLTS
ncbi:MAG: hypothetical protein RL266_2313 [Bacteroidota bacterium]|jgi:two-component system chemotaxis response regulator CheB